MERIDILGVGVSLLGGDELLTMFGRVIASDGRAAVLNVNANCLNIAWQEPWLRDYLNRADAVFADGYGVRLAAWLLGQPRPVRVTYAEWMWDLAGYCEKGNLSLYLLGAAEGVAEEAARRLTARYNALRVVGAHHGYFDKSHASEENRAVIREINRVRPNILVVGFGMPVQERWLKENWADIEANIALTGGGVFDYVSGRLRRPPRFLTDHGLEWLGRFLQEPRRLWRRYLLGNPLFMSRVIRQRLGLMPGTREGPCQAGGPQTS